MVYYNPYIIGSIIPYIPQTTRVFFIAHLGTSYWNHLLDYHLDFLFSFNIMGVVELYKSNPKTLSVENLFQELWIEVAPKRSFSNIAMPQK